MHTVQMYKKKKKRMIDKTRSQLVELSHQKNLSEIIIIIDDRDIDKDNNQILQDNQTVTIMIETNA